MVLKFSFIERQGEQPQGKSALEGINDKGYCFVVKKQDKSALSYHEEKVDNDKVEPNFKVGQWIVWQDKCYKVNYNGCGYELVDQNGFSTSLEYGTIDENAHIWDITKDAKLGDVLIHGDITFIFMGIDKDGIVQAISELWLEEPIACGNVNIKNGYRPATFNQRCCLFQAIRDIRFKWDDHKKQLIKSDVYGNIKRIC